MTASIAHGSCLCGAVRFSARLPSKWVAHCHCSYCRRAHGAAFVTWAGFRSDHVHIDPDGEQPTWYESSPGAHRAFCPRCGSPMLFTSSRWPGETHVARALLAGSLDREPSEHVFFNRKVTWLEVLDNLPKRSSSGGGAPSSSGPPTITGGVP